MVPVFYIPVDVGSGKYLQWRLPVFPLHVGHDINLIACHSHCIRPQMCIYTGFPPAACMDEHRPCSLLDFLNAPLGYPVLVMRVDSCKGKWLS
jgi:hypothetical protein